MMKTAMEKKAQARMVSQCNEEAVKNTSMH